MSLTLALEMIWSGWNELWMPIANHLWQSTLFAGLAGLLTLALKKNHPSTRYWLWFVSSVKFLVPFSPLVALGSRFSWLHPADTGSGAVLFAIRGPFGAGARPANPGAVSGLAFWPAAWLTLWAIGCAAVLGYWWLRWRQTAKLLQSASMPLEGREIEILREAATAAQIRTRVPLKVTNSSLEPGIVGVFRPVLFLPEGLSDRLSDAQLRAIADHELCHVRRKDNLTAAVHMVAQAVFWFHPMVWWIGEQMIHERERACDEAVLRLGNEPEAYAEGILAVCKFSLEAPRYLVAGVSGPKLRKRIEAIMARHTALHLDLKRKLLLAAAAAAAVLGPVANGALHPKAGGDDVAGQAAASSAAKYVLGDLKIEGDVHDRENIQSRILKAWKGREYPDAKQLADAVLQDGVRLEFQNRGYFKVLAKEPVVEPLGASAGEQSIRLVVPIEEGAQYRLGTVAFESAEAGKPLGISAETLREQVNVHTGDLVDVSAVHQGIARIKKLYAERNSRAEVTPQIAIDDQRNIIDVIFRVKETVR
jgi:beta-lactamase regulating signal transducer with metallopeptidase domain